MIGKALCLAGLLAACNTHHPGFPYGAPDAPVDTLSPTTGDAAPGAVTLTVTLRGAPVQGVAVYFQNPDSSVVRGQRAHARWTELGDLRSLER